MNVNISSPVPLVEITVDSLAAELGTNGSSFFSFNQTFSNLVLPGLSNINSGTIPNVHLDQGGLATFGIISDTALDVLSATYSIRLVHI